VGTRWIGGWGSSGDVVDSLDLAHGNPWQKTAPLVRVEAHRQPALAVDMEPHTAQRLATQLWHEGADHEIVQLSFGPDPTASWDRRVISVDGEPVEFFYLASAPAWVAFTQIEGRLVSVFARNIEIEEVELTEVGDADAYLNEPPTPRQ